MIVIHRAKIATMDPDRPSADAMATRGSRILAVGSEHDVRNAVAAESGGEPAAVEHHDGVILPGLIDSHFHMLRGGLKAMTHLRPGSDADAFAARMRETFAEPTWPSGDPSPADRIQALRLVQPWLHEFGITGVIDPAATPDEVRAYRAVHASGDLTVRTLIMPYLDIGAGTTAEIDDAMVRLAGVGVGSGFGDDTLRLGPVKIFVDGEGMRGQALLNEPWDDTGYHGHLRVRKDELAVLVAFCVEHGWGVGCHAVGGGAIDAVAQVFAAQAQRSDIAALRFQLIHGYLEPTAAAMEALTAAKVIIAAQPSIAWLNGRALGRRLGARASELNPLRSWLDSGATVALGSDGPFFPFDPRLVIWQAISRRVEGVGQPMGPGQAIGADEALAAYTRGAAVASWADDRRGMIRPGMLADWALWTADPRDVVPSELRELRVLRTDVGGRTVFARG